MNVERCQAACRRGFEFISKSAVTVSQGYAARTPQDVAGLQIFTRQPVSGGYGCLSARYVSKVMPACLPANLEIKSLGLDVLYNYLDRYPPRR